MYTQSIPWQPLVVCVKNLKKGWLLFFIFTCLIASAQNNSSVELEIQQRLQQAEMQMQTHFCGTMDVFENQKRPEGIPINNRFQQLRGGGGTWNLNDGYGSSCTNDCDLSTSPRLPASCVGNGNDIFYVPVVYTLNTTTGCLDGNGGNIDIPTQAELDAQIEIMNDFMVCQGIPMAFYQCQPLRTIDVGCIYSDANVTNISDVVNIYVFANTGNGTGCNGFAFLPNSTSSPTTVVMSHNCYNGFTYSDGTLDCNSPTLGSSLVLIHEIGHYLGLYHTHETGLGCDSPTSSADDCTTGDAIADTDEDPDFSGDEIGCTGCNTGGPNPDCSFDNTLPNCGDYGMPNTLNNVMGYNNFSGCRTAFSECQKAKMVDALLCARGPQMCCRDVDEEFANGVDDTMLEICLGDASPTFTAASDCYNWYDGLGASANLLTGNSNAFTPTEGTGAGQLDVNTPGVYTWYLGDLNEVNPDCRTMLTVTVLAEPGSGSGNGMSMVEVTSCNSSENISLSTDATTFGENNVVGWWITEDAAISTTVTDNTSLSSALGAATIGGSLSNPVNHLLEATGGTPMTNFTLAFDCSTLDDSKTYYATPAIASSRVAIPDANCLVNAGSQSNITFNGFAGKFNSIAPSDVCRPDPLCSPPTFNYCVTVSGFTGTGPNLSLIVRDDNFNGDDLLINFFIGTGDGNATYCFDETDIPDYDPGDPIWTTGMTVIVWEQGGNGMQNATISTTIDITYPGKPAIPFPSIASYNDCLFGTPVQLDCNCTPSNCPSVNVVPDGDGGVCSGGGTDDLMDWQNDVEATNPSGSNMGAIYEVVYSSVIPAVGSSAPDNQLPNGNHSGVDNCAAETQTVMAYLFCDADGSGSATSGDTYTLISTYTLTVYPQIQAPTIVTNGCQLTVTGMCSDAITLSNQSVTNGVITNNGTNSVTYTAQNGDAAGTIDITITSGILGSTCTYSSSTATPECAISCPTANTIPSDDGAVCSGGGTADFSDWQNDVATANPLDGVQDPDGLGSIVYSSITPDANGPAPDGQLPTGNHSGADNCAAETQTVSAYLYCDADDSGSVSSGDTYTLISTYTLTVYPAIQSPTIVTTGCELTVTGMCADLVTLSNQTVGSGMISNNGTNSVTYTAQSGDAAGTIDITITSGISGSTCTFSSSTATPRCAICSTVNTIPNDDGAVCSGGGTADFSDWQNDVTTANPLDGVQDPDGLGSIVYSSITPDANGPAPDGQLPTGNHSGADNCAAETQIVSAYLYCDADDSGSVSSGDTYTLISTYTLTVYPAIQSPTIVTTGCELTVTGMCADLVTLSNQTVGSGMISNNGTNSVTYTAQPNDNAGMIDVDIASGITGSSCSFSITIMTPSCMANCPAANTIPDETGAICSGDGTDTYSDWQNSVNAANPLDASQDPGGLGSIVYSSVTPMIGGPAPDNQHPTGNHSGADPCADEMQTIMAYLYCDADNSGMVNSGDSYMLISTYSLTVQPPLQAPSLIRDTDDCHYSLSFACPSDVEGSTNVSASEPLGYAGGNVLVEVINNNCLATFTIAKPACPLVPEVEGVVEDPCSCGDPQNTTIAGDYLFHDVLKVTGTPGQLVEVISADAEFRDAYNRPIPLPVSLPEVSTGIYEMDFWHRSDFSTDIIVQMNGDASTNSDFTSSICSAIDCNPNAAIPTMSEWGLILFALLMLNLSVVWMYRMQLAGIGESSTNFFPFQQKTFGRYFIGILLLMVVGFVVAVVGFGYELMVFDGIGTVLTAGLLAYLMQLVGVEQLRDEER